MNRELEQFTSLASFLGETLGKTFVAVLYDMADPGYPVAAAVNASPEEQEGMRELVSKAAGSSRARAGEYVANYPVSLDYVKMLRTSVFFVRGGEGEIAGALCLGMRCDLFWKMHALVSDMLHFSTEDFDGPEPPESAPAPREPSLDSIGEVVREFGIEPGRVSLDERMEIIVELYDMGVYKLKGAVARTAEALKISEQSVYRYLSKIRRARGD